MSSKDTRTRRALSAERRGPRAESRRLADEPADAYIEYRFGKQLCWSSYNSGVYLYISQAVKHLDPLRYSRFESASKMIVS